MLEANLVQEGAPKEGVIGKNVILSILIVAAVLAVYGGISFWKYYLNKEIAAIEASQSEKYAAFLKGNASSVIDFKQRSALAQQRLLENPGSAAEILDKIEKAILPQVYLTAYEYDEKAKQIKLECISDNFNTVAKQILSFKQSGDFKAVTNSDNKYDAKENKLTSDINLTLK